MYNILNFFPYIDSIDTFQYLKNIFLVYNFIYLNVLNILNVFLYK